MPHSKNVDSSSDIGLGMGSVLERANQEIEKLKKSTLNSKSRYWKPVKKRNEDNSKIGFKRLVQEKSSDNRGVYDEWRRGYHYFCEQTINTKGQKVQRQRLKDNTISFGKGIK